eukprot:CAMPEP_0119267712 /NCGR_PEP_ID=MMETSP1329-20130426/5752_1 /TAXON_ID=114041 /ORGANISM="Genus nov. species nov., Strain RCC1024" /LENGTH=156 /DNA_ID=CAMNT_0007267649 /DNA_START=180 /DNA_END=650 /DNA_ORIENTATION=+
MLRRLALLAAMASALRPAVRSGRPALTQRHLFGGAPPPEEAPPPPASGGKTMSVPGLGEISEDEMKLAMEFRVKLAEKMAATVCEQSALGGKVVVKYDGQGQPTAVEIDPSALASGEEAVSGAVAEAAKKAQAEALTKMKTIMMDMQKDIAKSLQA